MNPNPRSARKNFTVPVGILGPRLRRKSRLGSGVVHVRIPALVDERSNCGGERERLLLGVLLDAPDIYLVEAYGRIEFVWHVSHSNK